MSPYIVVDQFGYRTDAEKIAVIRNPQQGFDAGESFTPGATYALVDAATEQQVFTAAPTVWNGGATDESSGDKAWWFDFSEVTASSTYYVLDIDNNVRSAPFLIGENPYKQVLKHALRTFFYQRVNFAKETPYADARWTDSASHVGPLQDANCRLYSDPDNASTERDLTGGWYDAGDYNKYTSWTASYVVALLRTYEENPAAFGDDFDIPESGNGVPDIIDEVKWGLDHLVRLQNADGSVLSVMGLDHGSPPSSADGPSFYGSKSTAATLSAAAAYAYGAKIFAADNSWGYASYVSDLETRAENAWNWADANPNVLFYNNDDGYGTAGLAAGQQEVDDYGRLTRKIAAAIYLFEVTGSASYRDFVDAYYADVNMIQWTYVFPYQEENQDMLLYYARMPGATASVADDIISVYQSGLAGGDNMPSYSGNLDPYGAYLDSYTWGSNNTKAKQGLIFAANQTYALDNSLNSDAMAAAERYIHYIHGVNPLGLVYLSNMNEYGAEHSVNEFYHSWFSDGSPDWDRVGTSTYGPAPGYLTGGPNPSYGWDGCCDTNSCGSPENNAICTSVNLDPLRNQPSQKSYLDFNTSWPLNSWSVTENSCGYQTSYIRLLSKFVNN
ncbi:MAG: glycoside hydrolase family 9 protein [Deltaproteobacteria bacterium]|nr:glycoside hydrolase family 9 protein [Deltaproteobacteria bacterium]